MHNLWSVLLNDPRTNKLEVLKLIIPLNATFLLAIVSLTFVIYQLDRYKRFKHLRYRELSIFSGISVLIGILMPYALLQISSRTYSVIDGWGYIFALSSPMFIISMSALYLWYFVKTLSTEGLIKTYTYDAKSFNEAKNPLVGHAQAMCDLHGLLIQEVDHAESSPLVYSDNAMLRLTAFAIDDNDVTIFKRAIEQYIFLLVKKPDYSVEQRYIQDIQWIARYLIRENREDLYEYILDAFSIAWFSKDTSYKEVSGSSLYLFADLLYKYIQDGEDIHLIEKTAILLADFMLLMRQESNADMYHKSYSFRFVPMRAALQLAMRKNNYVLWLYQEKFIYFAHHAAEKLNEDLLKFAMSMMIVTGTAGKVYGLDCGAPKCSKQIFEHCTDGMDEIHSWRMNMNKDDKEWFDRVYKNAYSKLVGYQVTIDHSKAFPDVNIDKRKPMKFSYISDGPLPSNYSRRDFNLSNINGEKFKLLVERDTDIFMV